MLVGDQSRDLARVAKELAPVEKRLAELDTAFTRNLDRLDRGIINEREFAGLNSATRLERDTLTVRREPLAGEVRTRQERREAATAVLDKVRAFLEVASALPIQQLKARVQEILKTVRVWRDRVEIE